MKPINQVASLPLKESDIQRQIKDYLKLIGFYVVKIHQSLGSERGIADLYAIKGGLQLWIEVKTPKGTLSEFQKDFRAEIQGHGGIYIEARRLEDIQEYLKPKDRFIGKGMH
jgi:hypothetical protein